MSFVDEINNLRLPYVKLTIKNVKSHVDLEWIKEAYENWLRDESFPEYLVEEKHWIWFCKDFSNAISKERVLLIGKMNVLLFYIDDRAEQFVASNQFEELAMYCNELFEDWMDYTRINEKSSFESKMFLQIWTGMLPDLSVKLSTLIVKTLCDYFVMLKHISINYRQKLDKFIGLDQYIYYRRVDGCGIQLYYFVEYSLGIEFDDEIRCNKDYIELIGRDYELLLVCNDILSFKAELSRGEIMNYCTVYLYEKQCSLQEAVNNAFLFLIDNFEKYNACIERCIKWNNPLFNEFIIYCLCLYHGNMSYHFEGNRYGLVKNSSKADEYNERVHSKLVEVENRIKRKKEPIIDIPISKVIGSENAKLYDFY